MIQTTPNQSTLSSISTNSQSVICEYPENQIQRSKETQKLSRSHHYVCIFNPSIGNENIRSIHTLYEKISQHLPELLRNSHFKRNMKQAELHIRVYEEFVGQQKVTAHELKALSGKLGIPLCTTREWVLKGTIPVIYRQIAGILRKRNPSLRTHRLESLVHDLYYNQGLTQKQVADRLGTTIGTVQYIFKIKHWRSRQVRYITVEEAQEFLQKMKVILKGITNVDILESRLNTFYLTKELRQLSGYEKRYEFAMRYFKFLEIISKGGRISRVAKQCRTTAYTISRWLSGNRIPKLIRIAIQIPVESPDHQLKWLPLKMGNGRKMLNWIQVPTLITNYIDIQAVLSQINLIVSNTKILIDSVSQEDALMYILGITVSDGTIGTKKISNMLTISLSTKYAWSKDLLKAIRHYFSLLGIKTQKIHEIDRPYNCTINGETERRYSFQYYLSVKSPLITWIRRTLLGLDSHQVKSRDGVQADWILKMPQKLVVAFIQGLADGDGDASSGNTRVGIATMTNQTLYKQILEKLDIHSSATKQAVLIYRLNEIKAAAKIGVFRHALTRKKEHEQLVQMINTSTHRFVSSEERFLINELHDQGFSDARIRVALWKQLGVVRPLNTIRRHRNLSPTQS